VLGYLAIAFGVINLIGSAIWRASGRGVYWYR
jgi:hypothetical protein